MIGNGLKPYWPPQDKRLLAVSYRLSAGKHMLADS